MPRFTLFSLATFILCLAGEPALAQSANAPSIVKKDGGILEFRLGDELVTKYHYGKDVSKPFFYPVNAPGGISLTRGWPITEAKPGEQTDHVHQKSAWFCHGDVIPEGVEIKDKIKNVTGVDFWSEAKGHGRIVCVRVDTPTSSSGKASVTTVNEWQTADGVKILDETRTLTLHALDGARLLVVDIDLHASACPITFGDTKEGSFGIRVRTELCEAKGKGKMTNAEGNVGEGAGGNKDRKGCWGLISDWVDYSGPLDGASAGITVFADPSNPIPTCWHARGYGLVAGNPFGRSRAAFPDTKEKKDLVKLNKGDHLKLRYGILMHQGDVKEGKVAEHFKTFTSAK